MKKTLAFFTLLLGCVAMFAQSGPTFPYQAVVRNSQNQLIKDSTFAIGVEVYQATDLKYKETQSVTTNANGQFTMNIGGGTDTTGSLSDIADWSVAKFKITYHLSGGDIVSENAVSPVPYALQAANNTALTELLSTMNARMDSLGRLVDSLSNMPHGGAADGQPCPGAATVSDGTYTYHTVKIGSQCWTKENLKTESSMGTTRWPDNNENNVATYGLLYDRTALVQGESGATIRGICPVGWHVPNDDEWDELANYLLTIPDEIYQCGYDASNIANALSAPTGWSNRNDEGCYAGNRSTTRNRTGFSALPAGSYYNGYNLFGSCAYFWSATTNNASVRYRNLAYDNSTIRPFSLNSANCCFSVRCLRDAGIDGTPGTAVSCEDVMNCLGDTLDRLNARITSQGETITTQGETIATQGETITAQGQTITAQGETITSQGETIAAQGNTIDSLAHIVDSLSDLAHGTTPGEVSCEQVMLCLGDTLDRLNARITSQGETITTQGETIATQGETITAQGNTIDSLSHIVDSLSNLPHGGGDTPDTPTAFTCGTSKVTDVDGNEYNTVKIGNQCWTKENLRTKVGGVSDGDYGYPTGVTGNDTVTYGRLYTWNAMMKGASSTNYPAGTTEADTIVQGVCPTGWHVPSDAEWDTLTKYVYNSANPDYKCSGCESSVWEQSTKCIAKALSSTTGWNSNTSEGCNAGNTGDKANATGFSAVSAGGCFNGDSNAFGDNAYFWSATQNGGNTACTRTLHGSDSLVRRSNGYKGNGYSVRCLRDAGIGGGDEPSEPSEPVPPVTPTDTFDCGTDKVKDVQNNEYNTVQIGNQCWTKENLRTNVGTGDYGYPTGVSGTADTVTYGRLYSWAAVMNDAEASSDVPSRIQGICPEGWHVPSDGEWGNLINYVKSKPNEYKCGDDANNIANALSSETGWTNSGTSGCNAGDSNAKRNQTGFSAVPAGEYSGDSCANKGANAYFWSTTKINDIVRYYILGSDSSIVSQGFEFSENTGLSVRCLRN